MNLARESLVLKKYGKLTVMGIDSISSSGRNIYKCLCDCGEYKLIRGPQLRNGLGLACAKCLKKDYRKIQTDSKSKCKTSVCKENSHGWIMAMDTIKKRINRDDEYTEGDINLLIKHHTVSASTVLSGIKDFRIGGRKSSKIYLGLFILEQAERIIEQCKQLLKPTGNN
jgi:hypothetical protein